METKSVSRCPEHRTSKLGGKKGAKTGLTACLGRSSSQADLREQNVYQSEGVGIVMVCKFFISASSSRWLGGILSRDSHIPSVRRVLWGGRRKKDCGV